MYQTTRASSNGWQAISANSSHAHNMQSEMEVMARQAYNNASLNKSNGTFSTQESEVFITSVSRALERAASNSDFLSLPKSTQREAAKMLTEQFMHGQKLVNALQGAMNNPSTLAAQLVNNAGSVKQINVFDRIIDLNHPRTQMSPSTISHMGSHTVSQPNEMMMA